MSTTKDNQTQFAQVSPILEKEVDRTDPAVLRAQALKKRRLIIIVVSLVVVLITFLLLLSQIPQAPTPVSDLPAPTATPTPLPLDQSLLGRIRQGRSALEGIDLYQSDLVFPQIDHEITLDELAR